MKPIPMCRLELFPIADRQEGRVFAQSVNCTDLGFLWSMISQNVCTVPVFLSSWTKNYGNAISWFYSQTPGLFCFSFQNVESLCLGNTGTQDCAKLWILHVVAFWQLFFLLFNSEDGVDTAWLLSSIKIFLTRALFPFYPCECEHAPHVFEYNCHRRNLSKLVFVWVCVWRGEGGSNHSHRFFTGGERNKTHWNELPNSIVRAVNPPTPSACIQTQNFLMSSHHTPHWKVAPVYEHDRIAVLLSSFGIMAKKQSGRFFRFCPWSPSDCSKPRSLRTTCYEE